MNVLGLSGSLRAASLNSMLLRAAARIAPGHMRVRVYTDLGQLPLFNPDLEALDPAPVAQLRGALLECDAVIIASPEYAHGVSGVMKNALDWMVGNVSFVDKPVALLNAAPRATHAQAALRETLITMSARVIDTACVAVPLLGSALDEDGVMQDAGLRDLLRCALGALHDAVQTPPSRG
jgi:NAD(P)H-dependent FMN reductase